MIRILTLLLFVSVLGGCQTPTYRFKDNLILLPEELVEVSGASFYNDSIVVFVQDEKGKIYFYDLNAREVVDLINFSDDNDYEGVEVVSENEIFVLESDGDLYRVHRNLGEWKTKKFETTLKSKNDTEGLAYMPETNQLLVLCKEDNNQEDDKRKAIYSFDLNKYEMSKEPFMLLNIEDPGFRPTAISYEPTKKEFWITDTQYHRLCKVNEKGDLLYSVELKILPQAEGICVKGDKMIIASEGDHNGGMLIINTNDLQK